MNKSVIGFKKTKLAKNIKLILTDIDGVLTDGTLTFLPGSFETKQFNAKDGQLMSVLNDNFITGCISGRGGEIVNTRMENLGFDEIHLNIKNKLSIYLDLKEKYNLDDDEIAYIGDDIIDFSILSRVGYPACPIDAESFLFEHCPSNLFISSRKGGHGAFRDFINTLIVPVVSEF
jgi:3-deoxy-D-manno-octulosonate 8-phosphate phosphatase (KDO 8-P phosphatase)